MPSYTYECEDCGNVFNVIHTLNEEITECEECKSDNIFRHIGIPALHTNEEKAHINAGYTGKHQELVKKRRNKNYRDGHRNEIQQGEANGYENYKMAQAADTFAKMQAEGAKMTQAEKDAIKKEYGIDKNYLKKNKKVTRKTD